MNKLGLKIGPKVQTGVAYNSETGIFETYYPSACEMDAEIFRENAKMREYYSKLANYQPDVPYQNTYSTNPGMDSLEKMASNPALPDEAKKAIKEI